MLFLLLKFKPILVVVVIVVVKIQTDLLPPHTDSSILRNVDEYLPVQKHRHASNQATWRHVQND